MSEPRQDMPLPPAVAAQLSYHLRMAAVFAAAGELDESGSEAVLAWAVLATSWPSAGDLAAATASELIGQDQVGVSEPHRIATRNRAHALALELEGHFVTVGMHTEAELYATVAEHLDEVVATLVNGD